MAAAAPALTGYTPTITQAGNTFSGQAGGYYKMGKLLYLWGRFTANSSVAATSLTISLPAGETVDNGFISTGPNYGCGHIANNAAPPTQAAELIAQAAGTTLLAPGYTNTAAGSYFFHAIVPVN